MHSAIPVFQLCVWTSEPGFQLVKEQPSMVSPKEILQHVFRLPSFNIDRFQDRNNVFEQELRIVCSSGDTLLPNAIWIQKLKYLQFSSYPFLRPRD